MSSSNHRTNCYSNLDLCVCVCVCVCWQEYLSTYSIADESQLDMTNISGSRSVLNIGDLAFRRTVAALSQHLVYGRCHGSIVCVCVNIYTCLYSTCMASVAKQGTIEHLNI